LATRGGDIARFFMWKERMRKKRRQEKEKGEEGRPVGNKLTPRKKRSSEEKSGGQSVKLFHPKHELFPVWGEKAKNNNGREGEEKGSKPEKLRKKMVFSTREKPKLTLTRREVVAMSIF